MNLQSEITYFSEMGNPDKARLMASFLSELTGEARATYGASPGDDDHAEPYLYVLPLGTEVSGKLWNATGFKGAELGYAEILEAKDQRKAALHFFHERHKALTK